MSRNAERVVFVLGFLALVAFMFVGAYKESTAISEVAKLKTTLAECRHINDRMLSEVEPAMQSMLDDFKACTSEVNLCKATVKRLKKQKLEEKLNE